MALIDFPPMIEAPPADVRRVERGLLVPDRKLIKTSYDAMLPGMVPGLGLVAGAASAPPLEVAYLGEAFNVANQTTYTFNSVPLGEASPYRTILLSLSGRNAAALRNISSVTLNGTAMSVVTVQRLTSGSITLHQALYQLAVPTGTTATVVVTWNGGVIHTHIASYRVLNAGSIVAGAGGVTGSSLTTRTLTNTVNSGSYIVCGHTFCTYQTGATVGGATTTYNRQDGGEATIWTGATTLRSISGSHSITVTNGGNGQNFGSAGASCIVNP